MNFNTNDLIEPIEDVIQILESRVEKEPEPVLLTLLSRYQQAKSVIEKNEKITKINIYGGIKAYLDTFSDYSNPLLAKMAKVEEKLKKYEPK
ncbi:hypothetical protein [Streptococcus intermedius]|uniref:hypothetical protein n=1 Tax=Streptococcus intermedius TaxID=1338 RepID=UPI0006CB0FE6|nr:hypothetical protein [Streptococcus intermedius]ALF27618.1 hypothetical protein RN88_03600 [Streptococcus intermedius]ALF28379.1 hypothetical protein RN88_07745 [Streptococcus intermedius]ARC26915.1 hypothetical protein A6J72_06810 [Streptococcus intermedius]